MMKYEHGKNPNSLANLKRTAGPGRPKMSSKEKAIRKIVKEHIMDHLKEYLTSGEASQDFEKIRQKRPDVSLDMALNRVYGRIDRPIGGSDNSGTQVNLLIQVLTGKLPGSLEGVEAVGASAVNGESPALIEDGR